MGVSGQRHALVALYPQGKGVLPPSSGWMMGAVRTSETSVDNYFTPQYIPEDNSEQHM
jgi:hypothetical protein